MNLYKIIITTFLLTISLYSQGQTIFERWHQTDKLVWDKKIDRDDAIDSFSVYLPLAVKECYKNIPSNTLRSEWLFPMIDWTKIVYRDTGKDYRDDKFDYFQGAESKGHPAHDIFILDKDANGVEDSTGEKVSAVSMVNGVVITVHTNWKIGDVLRSGNYVKVFDPKSKGIFYYSHLDSVFVNVGQYVKAGEPLGHVGRTGRKAINGKTHIHIAYYKIEDGIPEPVDIINDLYSSEKRMKK